jgi:hypothetical protein
VIRRSAGPLGQDRVGKLIGHGIHEHLVVTLAVGDDGCSPPADLPESCLAVGPDGGQVPREGQQQDVVKTLCSIVQGRPSRARASVASLTRPGRDARRWSGRTQLCRRAGRPAPTAPCPPGRGRQGSQMGAGTGGLLVPGLHRLDGGNMRALAHPSQDLRVAAPLQVGGEEVMAQGA